MKKLIIFILVILINTSCIILLPLKEKEYYVIGIIENTDTCYVKGKKEIKEIEYVVIDDKNDTCIIKEKDIYTRYGNYIKYNKKRYKPQL